VKVAVWEWGRVVEGEVYRGVEEYDPVLRSTAVQIRLKTAMRALTSRDIVPVPTCFVKAGWWCHSGGVYGGAVQVI
jgi:hypothetical protein